MAGTTRIGPRRPRKVYIAEWREQRGLTQKQLGERLGVSDMTISRWENSTGGHKNTRTNQALPNTDVLAAIAEALGIEPADLYRHPEQPSADALLRDQTPDVRNQVFRVIEALRKAN